jgi:predicted nuclease of predicted toxin-antitoxin system
MKFLLDENISPALADLLKNIGYEARHVIEVGYNMTSDFKIAEFAATTGEIIVTHDTDFGTILALTGQNRPSVILIRWQSITTLLIFEFLEKYLLELEEDLQKGSLVVVEDNKIRIRLLPLKVKNVD